ncbi:MAG TPA: LysM peptidoglycan-binding domain-containing protein [Solirubrobacteraceae bacterium]|jgi:LysM repeat protein|nr:LysM peptidoglycan-binding domain-containing protein [Solirubrobacteraceae bacterium]
MKRLLVISAAALLALPATAAAQFAHVVAPGESLTSIASADGLTVDQLAAANGLSPDAQLVSGTTVQIPPQDAAAVPQQAASPVAEAVASAPTGGYVVQPGDTLSGLAAQAGVTVAQLAAANGLDPNGTLLAGSSLTLPGGAAAAPSSGADTGNATLPGGSGGPYPTAETVDASTVGSIASSNGVPASLGDAVGWQESGFNNDLVSGTGAVGVMQIEPYTWNYINQVLSPGAALDPYSATDNVRAGSMLLQSLLQQTGGNLSLAAAGYYQGLQSVEQNGMYTDTQQYVNDVMALQSQFGGG